MGAGFGVAMVLVWGFLLGMYFLPTMIAVWRKHANSGAIACLNCFLGWTVLGWIGSLVWAVSNRPTAPVVHIIAASPPAAPPAATSPTPAPSPVPESSRGLSTRESPRFRCAPGHTAGARAEGQARAPDREHDIARG